MTDQTQRPLVILDDPATYPPELRDTLDGKARRWFFNTWPPQRLLPDTEPVYVKSWLYVFGVGALVSLLMLIVSGSVLAVFGPAWWMKSYIGGWFDALHYWAVQLFFLFMLAHFIAVFIMGAFRGRRVTWMLGILCFIVAATTGLTGFVSLQDFEGQWVATQAKDAINSTGMGGILNLMNIGQILTMHVVIFPLATAAIAALHILWVRKHGIAPPYDANPEHQAADQEVAS